MALSDKPVVLVVLIVVIFAVVIGAVAWFTRPLGLAERTVLEHLWEQGDSRTIREIMGCTGLDRFAVNNSLHTLVDMNYVIKAPDIFADQTRYRITPEGQKHLKTS